MCLISGDSRAEDPFIRLFLSLPPFIKVAEEDEAEQTWASLTSSPPDMSARAPRLPCCSRVAPKRSYIFQDMEHSSPQTHPPSDLPPPMNKELKGCWCSSDGPSFRRGSLRGWKASSGDCARTIHLVSQTGLEGGGTTVWEKTKMKLVIVLTPCVL